MHATARHRILNLVHTVLLFAGMALVVWIATRALANELISLVVAVGIVLALLFAPQVPKEMLLGMYRARRLEPSFPEARHILQELARRAGLPDAPALYYIPTSAPLAFAVGRRADSAIGVSDGLLRMLTLRELAGVLAHETSHIAHDDLRVMALADVMTRVTTVLSYLGQFVLLLALPLLLLGQPVIAWWAPLALILSPTLSSLLQLALSRTREFNADLGAAELTDDPLALASALAKLERRQGAFWEEILLPGRRIPEPSLLRTHPPTHKRIERLKTFAADHPGRQPRFGIDLGAERAALRALRPVVVTPRLHWHGLWF